MNKPCYIFLVFLLGFFPAFAGNFEFEHITVKDGLANSTVYYAMQDSRGFLWFCTETGVNRYDGHHFETFTINDGLADNENFKCFEDSKGRLWFLSYNGKLSFFLAGKFYNAQNTPWLYLPTRDAYLFDVKEGKDKSIWFSTVMGDVIRVKDQSVAFAAQPPRPVTFHRAYCLPVLFMQDDSIKKLAADPENNTLYLYNLESKKLEHLGTFPDLTRFRGVRMINQADEKHGFFFTADTGIYHYGTSCNQLSLYFKSSEVIRR